MIALDLHIYAKIAKCASFHAGEVRGLVGGARTAHLAGLVLTEHIGAGDIWALHDALRWIDLYDGGLYRAEGGAVVLTGAEIRLAMGGELLVLAPLEALWQLDRTCARPLSAGYRPGFDTLAAALCGLLIGAHPTRVGKELVGHGQERLPRLAAPKINACERAAAEAAARLAQELGQPLEGGSDAPLGPHVGLVATALRVETPTFAWLRKVLRVGEVGRLARPAGAAVLDACRRHRRPVASRRPRSADIRAD